MQSIPTSGRYWSAQTKLYTRKRCIAAKLIGRLLRYLRERCLNTLRRPT